MEWVITAGGGPNAGDQTYATSPEEVLEIVQNFLHVGVAFHVVQTGDSAPRCNRGSDCTDPDCR